MAMGMAAVVRMIVHYYAFAHIPTRWFRYELETEERC